VIKKIPRSKLRGDFIRKIANFTIKEFRGSSKFQNKDKFEAFTNPRFPSPKANVRQDKGMMEKYHNKYRVKSARLREWDYSSSGHYFITICAKDRINYFGRIIGGIVALFDIGKITEECWQNIPMHFPYVELDESVVMPNHVHGIIVIKSKCDVETQNFASLRNNKFGPQSRNLGSVIRGFKIGVKKWATMNNINFQWQSGFYEHIIRDEKSLQTIRRYIIENPLKWEFDKENLHKEVKE
jgi:REP element-mobilizing transposase RayT